ncbi:hypothetical protein FH972_012705 [Carpinus fangiana]|uniref:Uncharacterized protein n=1 Tax=Carpinus fangiana TaxID=176857 RepID=A0A5N6R7S5_9ROSI|nr:hypothetical protein FH972_012705 [Carpinus fangiana]
MIQSTIQAEREQHNQQMNEILAQQREAIITVITTQVAMQMAVYEARIHVLEGFRHVNSEPKVTNDRASPARVIVRSSVNN